MFKKLKFKSQLLIQHIKIGMSMKCSEIMISLHTVELKYVISQPIYSVLQSIC